MKKLSALSFMFLITFLFWSSTVDAAAQPVRLFGDNMVLQTGREIPVWGTADPKEEVTVSLNGKSASVKAGEDGKWLVKLPAMEVGGPYELTVAAGNNIVYKNVMIGEVWLCSGQSNMAFTLSSARNAEDEIAAAEYPNIRGFTVPRKTSQTPLDDLEGGGWETCSPKTAGRFTAVGYFFARAVHLETKVPVGLIHSSWGGTLAEAWTSSSTLQGDPDYTEILKRGEAILAEAKNPEVNFAQKLEERKKKLAELAALEADFESAAKLTAIELDDAGWKEITFPSAWEKAGLPGLDGMVFFRKTIEVSPEDAGKDMVLNLGPIDEIDVTWFNGELVGVSGNFGVLDQSQWNVARHYPVPGKFVKAGKNVITVRVIDVAGEGGLWGGPAAKMQTEIQGGKSIPLAGKWKYQVALDVPADVRKPGVHNVASALYNGMINPLIPYAIRGAIWYQGESNAGRAYQYRKLFPDMIKDWRGRWNQGDFPFYFVQLANFTKRQENPDESTWAELREAQTLTLSQPHTGMAVIIDIGAADDIHPKNKQDVGLRLALWALAKDYGKELVYSSPMYDTMKTEGASIRLSFKNVGEGLSVKGDEAKGFAIAGADKKFVWAKAKLEGNDVIVSAEEVKEPVAVRYAWGNNPECNLYNSAGLPACPFRTDDWPGRTINGK